MIYLSGPMLGLSREEMSRWRRDVTSFFNNRGVEVFDPTDFPGDIDEATANAKEIVERDIAALDRCSVLLANVDRPSFGTPMEIVYFARVLNRPTVVCASPETRASSWLRYHATRLESNLVNAALAALQLDLFHRING